MTGHALVCCSVLRRIGMVQGDWTDHVEFADIRDLIVNVYLMIVISYVKP